MLLNLFPRPYKSFHLFVRSADPLGPSHLQHCMHLHLPYDLLDKILIEINESKMGDLTLSFSLASYRLPPFQFSCPPVTMYCLITCFVHIAKEKKTRRDYMYQLWEALPFRRQVLGKYLS